MLWSYQIYCQEITWPKSCMEYLPIHRAWLGFPASWQQDWEVDWKSVVEARSNDTAGRKAKVCFMLKHLNVQRGKKRCSLVQMKRVEWVYIFPDDWSKVYHLIIIIINMQYALRKNGVAGGVSNAYPQSDKHFVWNVPTPFTLQCNIALNNAAWGCQRVLQLSHSGMHCFDFPPDFEAKVQLNWILTANILTPTSTSNGAPALTEAPISL